MKTKPAFMNFAVDHMTLLLHPKLYNVSYAVFRIIFGATPEDLLYEKKRPGKDGAKDVSMTYATRVGNWSAAEKDPLSTIFAIVQPSEPEGQASHVKDMLEGRGTVAHLQHIALRTPDLIAFHQHASERGVQWVTPILKDEEENLIQAFSGEWYFPGSKPTGLFFEFLQREPSDSALAEIQRRNKQSWFRDETFLGLYDEKEREYRSGKVKPFLSEELFEAIIQKIGHKQVYEITEQDLAEVEELMLSMTRAVKKAG